MEIYKKEVKVIVDIPNGYEFVRFGPPRKGDLFHSKGDIKVQEAIINFISDHVIIREIK